MITNSTPQRALRGHRPHRLTDRAALTGKHHAHLAAHLTPRDRWLARVLYEHRVLTSTQIAQLVFPSARAANHRLLQLYRWRVLDRFQPFLSVGSAPMHYVLDTAGAAMLAAEDDLDTTTVRYRHDRALGIAHSLRLAHTVGVNGFFTALIATARSSRDGAERAVTAWWSEARCARHFGDLVRPDGYGRWRETRAGHTSEVEFFLEYDFGTETLGRLAGKLAGYQRLAATSGITTPVLIWLPSAARETTARPALAAALAALERPGLVPVATTAANLTSDGGNQVPDSPAVVRWLPIAPHSAPAPPPQRVTLLQLAQVWPDAARSSTGGTAPAVPQNDPPADEGLPERAALLPPSPMPPPATETWLRHERAA